MTPALLSLAEGGGTQEPLLVGFLLAQKINTAAGGAFIAPWEIGELPAEWIEAAMALNDRLPGMRQGKAKVADYLAKWRKEQMSRHG